MTKEQIEKKAREILQCSPMCEMIGEKCRIGDCANFQYITQMAEWLLDNLWIDVEEQLPPFEECVIVHYDNGGRRYGEMFSHRTEDDYVIKDKYDFCNYSYEKITHWMPIPKLNKK